MQVLSKEQQTYIEVHADEILREKGVSKLQFANAMGVKPQNINKLIASKNIVTLTQMANYFNLPLQVLIYGDEDKEHEIKGCIFINGTPHIVNNKEDIECVLKQLK